MTGITLLTAFTESVFEEVYDSDLFIAASALRSVTHSAFDAYLIQYALQVPLHVDHPWTWVVALRAVVSLK